MQTSKKNATFRQLLDSYIGSFRQFIGKLWLSLPGNGSWTRHYILWTMNLILHYNSCKFRAPTDGIYNDWLTNKTQQRTVAFSNLCFCLKQKQNKTKKKQQQQQQKLAWTATYSFIKLLWIYIDLTCKTTWYISC